MAEERAERHSDPGGDSDNGERPHALIMRSRDLDGFRREELSRSGNADPQLQSSPIGGAASGARMHMLGCAEDSCKDKRDGEARAADRTCNPLEALHGFSSYRGWQA